jgi:hypothetical protein
VESHTRSWGQAPYPPPAETLGADNDALHTVANLARLNIHRNAPSGQKLATKT